MSLFGGLDLGSPEERNRQAITRDLELRRDRWGLPGYYYRGSADLLLQHGSFYAGRVLPEALEPLRGPMQRCFTNALQAARTSGLRYCEGVYWTGFGHAKTHAWVLDADDLVCEVTMPTRAEELAGHLTVNHTPFLAPEHWAYYGVTFDVELVQAHLEALTLPMFDRTTGERLDKRGDADFHEPHDWPLLKVAYNPNRKTLP